MAHGAKIAELPCFRCGYDLAGLEESAPCPECGLEGKGARCPIPLLRVGRDWIPWLGLLLLLVSTVWIFVGAIEIETWVSRRGWPHSPGVVRWVANELSQYMLCVDVSLIAILAIVLFRVRRLSWWLWVVVLVCVLPSLGYFAWTRLLCQPTQSHDLIRHSWLLSLEIVVAVCLPIMLGALAGSARRSSLRLWLLVSGFTVAFATSLISTLYLAFLRSWSHPLLDLIRELWLFARPVSDALDEGGSLLIGVATMALGISLRRIANLPEAHLPVAQ